MPRISDDLARQAAFPVEKTSEDILWTEAGRLAADIRETFGTVCELRDRASGAVRDSLTDAAATLYTAWRDSWREAQMAAEDSRETQA